MGLFTDVHVVSVPSYVECQQVIYVYLLQAFFRVDQMIFLIFHYTTESV